MSVAWGILSTARINEWVLEACADSELVDFVAVASRDAGRAERFAASHGLRRAYGSYDELLADPDVAAVYISLPNSLHMEYASRALEAGKHVLCEKPLGRRPATVAAAFDRAEAAGLVLAEALMYRHHPQTTRVVELVHDGAIGELALIRASMSFALDTSEKDARLDPALDGGALMDVGCYCVSAVRLLAGEPERVYGRQSTEGLPVDTRFAGTLEFPGAVLAQFDCAMTLPRRDALEVVGTEGALFLADPWHCRDPTFELRTGKGHEDREVVSISVDPNGDMNLRGNIYDAYTIEFEAFSKAVLGEDEPTYGRSDAVAQACTLEALYASAAAGQPVRPSSIDPWRSPSGRPSSFPVQASGSSLTADSPQTGPLEPASKREGEQ